LRLTMTLKHWRRAEQRSRSAFIVAMPLCAGSAPSADPINAFEISR
jgi:hypothetical protein